MSKLELVSQTGIKYLNQYYIAFCTKYRRPVLVNEIAERLELIIRDVAKEKGVIVKKLEILPDQVHLIIKYFDLRPPHDLIRQFKGSSSRLLREEYSSLKSRIPSLWTRHYFCCTIGVLDEAAMENFIEKQKSE